MKSSSIISLTAIGMILFFWGCTSRDIAMEPATDLYRDVFVAQGITEEDRWVGVGDQFDPETTPRVAVVARLAEEDREKIVTYELVNPAGNIAWTENRFYPKQKTLALYLEMPSLLRRGSEGKWQANVYADGEPIGQSNFFIGEKVEEQEETGSRYFVVGAEPEDEPDEEDLILEREGQYDSYIQEVTPELQVPLIQGFDEEIQEIELPEDPVLETGSIPEPLEDDIPMADE
ncbi:MAG: hypothetical protein ACOX5R_01340 [bacterium]